ncbi:MAG: hypothetical protein OEY86_14915 [Nitrospira sp.]|nr:hypothetical protein [Nitrospira sp.]
MDVESLAQIRHIVTEAVQGVREEMAALGTELRSEITDTKRHMGVLTEGIRHEVQLVAEAVQLQSERMTDIRHEVERQARETRALFQLSFEQLHKQVGNLEQRLQMNE